jgi:hypothetical protein
MEGVFLYAPNTLTALTAETFIGASEEQSGTLSIHKSYTYYFWH